jgi:uncharacterized protein
MMTPWHNSRTVAPKIAIRGNKMLYKKKLWAAGVVSLVLCGSLSAATLDEATDAIKVQDYDKAAKILQEVAKGGEPDAQFLLAMMYETGRGVKEDDQEAFKWYKAAAERGHQTAQNNLGQMYRQGKGVKADMKEAARWFRAAAEQGNSVAQYNLGVRYMKGEGVKKDLKEGVSWYHKSAENNNMFGQFSLAYSYAAGEGVDKNIPEAFAWAQASSALGFGRAQQFVGYLMSKMSPEELQAGEKRFGELRAQLQLPEPPPPLGPDRQPIGAASETATEATQ